MACCSRLASWEAALKTVKGKKNRQTVLFSRAVPQLNEYLQQANVRRRLVRGLQPKIDDGENL